MTTNEKSEVNNEGDVCKDGPEMAQMKEPKCKLLTEEEYVRIFKTFTTKTTQYRTMSDLAKPLLKSFAGKAVDMMSIGAGTGCLEDDFVRNLKLKLNSFFAIEPNSIHRTELAQTVSKWGPSVETVIECGYFDESFATDKRFDVILMAHSIYYMENAVKAIANAKSFLKQNGKLLIYMDSGKGDYDLFARIAQTVSMHNRIDIKNPVTISTALGEKNIKHEIREGPGEVDVSDFINKSKRDDANDFLSLILNRKYDKLSKAEQSTIYELVKERVSSDGHGRFVLNVPVGLIIID